MPTRHFAPAVGTWTTGAPLRTIRTAGLTWQPVAFHLPPDTHSDFSTGAAPIRCVVLRCMAYSVLLPLSLPNPNSLLVNLCCVLCIHISSSLPTLPFHCPLTFSLVSIHSFMTLSYLSLVSYPSYIFSTYPSPISIHTSDLILACLPASPWRAPRSRLH